MAKQSRRPDTIHLSHLLSDNTGQVGLVNVNVPAINLSIAPRFTIVRTANHGPNAAPSGAVKDPKTATEAPAAPSTEPPGDFHIGPEPVHQTLISGKLHTIVHPDPDGTCRIVYSKTRSLFTFTSPVKDTASPPNEANEPDGPAIKNIDGYRIKFDAPRPVDHAGVEKTNRANDPAAPPLMGLPLSIYRSGRGTEYFLLTNYYFDLAPSRQAGLAGDPSPKAEPPAPAPAPPGNGGSSNGSDDTDTGELRGNGNSSSGPDYDDIVDRCLQITLSDGCVEVTRRTFYLDNPPIKLGDGSFGVVYQLRELVGVAPEPSENVEMRSPRPTSGRGGDKYAIKIFYNRQMMTRTGLIRVEPESFNKFVAGDDDRIKDVREISIAGFLGHLFQSLEKNRKEDVYAQATEILAQSERLQNISAKRFGRERDISRSIRTILDSVAGVNANAVRCVQTEYDTTRFRESSMFKFLQAFEQEKKSSTADNLSDYAIVMELYNFTLEDMLEAQWAVWKDISDKSVSATGRYRAKPVPGENIVGGRKIGSKSGGHTGDNSTPPQDANVQTGYGMLQSLSFAQRLSVIYPIIEGLSTALQMLHATRNYHHDIKPGNVFVNADLQNFYVALGDFSFVGSGVDEGTTEAVLRDSIQTGSLHYRSPEQRDFNDAAYGVVRHSECCDNPGREYPEFADRNVGGDDGWAYVRIPDPKFRGSTIGLNDVVVFPADRNGTAYRVVEVRGVGEYRDVWLNVSAKEFMKLFPEETRTKVFLYKVPTVRSDLFGLGAVFFDLLTGGQSAERFYEALRPFDVSMEPAGEDAAASYGGVRRWTAKVMAEEFAAYVEASKAGNRKELEAALSNMFQFFRRGNDFAPPEVVEIIVKLMGGYLEDSYVNTRAEERPVPEHLLQIAPEALPVSWALQDIKAVEQKGIYDLRDGLVQKGAYNLLLRPEGSQHLLEIAVGALGSIPPEPEDGTDNGATMQEEAAKPKSWIDRVAGMLRTVPQTS